MPDKFELDLGAYDPELGYSVGRDRGHEPQPASQPGAGQPGAARRKQKFLRDQRRRQARQGSFRRHQYDVDAAPRRSRHRSDLRKAADSYIPAHPEAMVATLAEARPLIAAIDDPIARRKLIELDEMIAAAGGVWVEALADKADVTPGGNLKVTLTALNRGTGEVTLLGAKWIATFRDKLFTEYKAQRPPMPEDLSIQLPFVRRLCEAMRLPIIEVPGYEADDVIGALAQPGRRAQPRRLHRHQRQRHDAARRRPRPRAASRPGRRQSPISSSTPPRSKN